MNITDKMELLSAVIYKTTPDKISQYELENILDLIEYGCDITRLINEYGEPEVKS